MKIHLGSYVLTAMLHVVAKFPSDEDLLAQKGKLLTEGGARDTG